MMAGISHIWIKFRHYYDLFSDVTCTEKKQKKNICASMTRESMTQKMVGWQIGAQKFNMLTQTHPHGHRFGPQVPTLFLRVEWHPNTQIDGFVMQMAYETLAQGTEWRQVQGPASEE